MELDLSTTFTFVCTTAVFSPPSSSRCTSSPLTKQSIKRHFLFDLLESLLIAKGLINATWKKKKGSLIALVMSRRGVSTFIATVAMCALSSVILVWHRGSNNTSRINTHRPRSIDETFLLKQSTPAPKKLDERFKPVAVAGEGSSSVNDDVAMPVRTAQRVFRSEETVIPNRPYAPTHKHWKSLVFDFTSTQQDLDDGGCTGWMQTGRCRADGPPEPFFSKSCDTMISGPSGFCLCRGIKKAGGVSCDESRGKGFTCRSICARGR